jgi:hypothetical protein
MLQVGFTFLFTLANACPRGGDVKRGHMLQVGLLFLFTLAKCFVQGDSEGLNAFHPLRTKKDESIGAFLILSMLLDGSLTSANVHWKPMKIKMAIP